MANTKNSKAAKIRKKIIEWIQDDTRTEVISTDNFPGLRGIRAVTLRHMLGELGYNSSVVMGAVSGAPTVDHRIQKAMVTPREVYYYFDEGGQQQSRQPAAQMATEASTSTPATAAAQAATSTVTPAGISTTTSTTMPTPAGILTADAQGLAGTSAFLHTVDTNQQLSVAINDLLVAAQSQRPLTDLELNFLTTFSAQVAKQTELLQNFATQSKIDQLRRN